MKEIKIAYVGGGSRGWAWGLMSDLALADDIGGEISLYDIDFDAAKSNEIIADTIEENKEKWNYKAVKTIGEALESADFVIISILPGTFDEMASDVHTPEKYGIYQSVGDTVGPGGIVRALRTVPMIEEIARAIEKYAPDAWVINYTNPMTLCIKALYNTFPKIKAFGCCHEVFGTQYLMVKMLDDMLGIKNVERDDIKVNVVGVNHFTWFTSAYYKGQDIFPIYKEFAEKYYDSGFNVNYDNLNGSFACRHRVKFDLFRRFNYIAAAGDRHLAEFCPGDWYLKSPEQVESWMFGLTGVEWRKNDLKNRLARSRRLVNGEEKFVLKTTGEAGVSQIRAILGLGNLITNVNLPNIGQIPNMPLGAIVETNAVFTSGKVEPVMSGNLPLEIAPLVSKVCGNQEILAEAARTRNLEMAFSAFANDSLVRLPLEKSRELFRLMLRNTAEYLKDYNISSF